MAKKTEWHGSDSLRGSTREIAKLTPDPKNARLHDERNLDAIRASLKKFGQQKPIIVDKKGLVVAGNGTLEAAKSLGWTHIAVVESNLKGLDLRAFAIADNKTAELAEWNYEQLSGQLRELKAAMPDTPLDFTGFADFEIEPMLQAVWTPPAISDSHVAGNGALTVKFDSEQAKVVNSAVDRIRASKGDMPIAEAMIVLCRMLVDKKKPA